MINNEVSLKLLDFARDIVKAKNDLANQDPQFLAMELGDTFMTLCKQLNEHPAFKVDELPL